MNYYELLELPRDASLDQLKKNYERLSMKALWDKPLRAKLDEAYEVLSDIASREVYDEQLPAVVPEAASAAEVDKTVAIEQAMRTQVLEPQPCPVCQTVNEPSARYCIDCGYELSGGAVEGFEQTADEPAGMVGQSGHRMALRIGENSIGRVGTDIVIPDPSVSRNHATLELLDDKVLLRDLGSTNGTRINGTKLTANVAERVYHLDTLRFGQAEMEFVCPSHARPEAPISEVGDVAAVEAKPMRWLFCSAEGALNVKLPVGEAIVGRRHECDVQLSDPYASGRHLRLMLMDDEATVEDLGSTNGTMFNGQTLLAGTIQTVRLGDQIQIGSTIYSLLPIPSEESVDAQ